MRKTSLDTGFPVPRRFDFAQVRQRFRRIVWTAFRLILRQIEEDLMSWTDERVELLRKLWAQGLSASQIAHELANGITRNAVIGKVHRLGMSGRVKAASSASSRPRMKSMRPAHSRPSTPIIREQHLRSRSGRSRWKRRSPSRRSSFRSRKWSRSWS